MLLKIIFPAILIISLFPSLRLSGQARWIHTYHENEDVVLESIIESYDKGIILSGKHGPNYSKYNWLIKTDINGEVLWEKIIGNGVNSIALLDLEQDQLGNIYTGGLTKAYDPQGDPLILKFNPCGEKEWCRIFYTEGHYDFTRCFTLTTDGNIVIVLLLTNPEPWVERICLAKLSHDGELIWKQCYTSSDTSQRNEDISDIIVTSDAGFLMTGFCDYEDPTVPNKWWLHPYYLKTDSLGNFEWETVAYKETEMDGGIGWNTVMSPDNLHYYSSISHHHHYDTILRSCSLLKMNLQGNVDTVFDVISGYKYGKLTYAQFLNDSVLAAEAGWGNTEDSVWTTAILLDTLGNSIVSSVLFYEMFTSILDITFDKKLLYATNTLQNEEFDVYLTKLNQDLEQDTFYTQPITYDSLCPYQIVSDTIVQDDCGLIVGVEEEDKTVGREDFRTVGLELWPNPCQEMLNVECSMLNSGKGCSLSLFDIYGRELLSSPFQGGGREGGEEHREVQFTIDVSSLPPGIYLLSVVEDGKRIAGGKFVVAR